MRNIVSLQIWSTLFVFSLEIILLSLQCCYCCDRHDWDFEWNSILSGRYITSIPKMHFRKETLSVCFPFTMRTIAHVASFSWFLTPTSSCRRFIAMIMSFSTKNVHKNSGSNFASRNLYVFVKFVSFSFRFSVCFRNNLLNPHSHTWNLSLN